jgi:RNA polymerase sigma-70 factor (ECF subfamily)
MISEFTLPALVYTTTSHLIISYLRRRAHHEQYEHIIRHSSMMETTSTESVFSVQEITERLEHGLARLPENCREVYRLHIYGGMKVSEISTHLGEDYKSVEHRLGAARNAIRQYLHQYA